MSTFNVRETPGFPYEDNGTLRAFTFVEVLSLTGIGCLRKHHCSALPSDSGIALASQPELLLPQVTYWVTYLCFLSLIFPCLSPLATCFFPLSKKETHQVTCLL